MKKIWSWLLLLLLLIILCIWTKKDSIHISSNTGETSSITSALATHTKHIDYTIKQIGKAYALTGNFANQEQQNSLSDTCTAAASSLVIKETTTDKSLAGEAVIALTNKILPHFIANYSNGEINYKNKLLTVNGDVEGYDAKRTMQTLLNASTIASADNTKVLLTEPINFSIKKDPKQLQLSGTFTNKKQIRKITKHLRPTYSTVNLRKNAHRIDKGIIVFTESILPSFIKNYTDGEITYTYETLIIKGTVKTQAALDEMNTLLSKTSIPMENFSMLDPMVAQQMQAEKDALIAKEKAAQEETAKRLAKEDARKKAAQKAKLAAQALQEASNKETQMNLSAQAAKKAKDSIAKLLKIENIEFEVAKGSLTQKGKVTVDKLANIIRQYPNISIEIAGHTDSDGSAQFNQKLSQERVNAVKEHLISKSIQAKQLTAKGYGESKPLVPNTSDANKAKNRRVEINTQGN